MKVNQDEVINYLKKQPKVPVCPLCTNSKWVIGEHAFQLPEYNKNPFENKTVYPVIPVICDVCGYTFFVNALSCNAVSADKGDLENGSKEN
ncbi:MAG: hypothetical protein PUF50_02845 [Erysipelotrichaceae bacterium]|nr:hypothetical protein [Erysipelotrichaceae bacterium]